MRSVKQPCATASPTSTSGLPAGHGEAGLSFSESVSAVVIDRFFDAGPATPAELQHSRACTSYDPGGSVPPPANFRDVCVLDVWAMSPWVLVPVVGTSVKTVSENIARSSPNAIVIVVSNPLDVMCYVAKKVTGFPKSTFRSQAETELKALGASVKPDATKH